jgi:GxxExxY protein
MKNMTNLVNTTRQTGFNTHVYFKNGFLEKVYENALAHRLSLKGFSVAQQVDIPVRDYDGTEVGHYVCDLLIEKSLLVEIKAVQTLDDVHSAQLLAYLKATGIKHGMLMNFGAPKYQVKKLIL